jgi:CheY-like chemotaxis protein
MLKPILLVEDDARDLELTLVALERSQLANEVIVVRDGAQALDYLKREGGFAGRAPGNPAVVLLDLKLPKVNGLEVLQAVAAQHAGRDADLLAGGVGRGAQLRAGRQRLRGQAGGIQAVRHRHRRPGRVLGGAQRAAPGKPARQPPL